MTSLYELSAAYRQLEDLTEADITDEAYLALIDEADQAIREKSVNVAMLIRNVEALAASIKEAETRMAQRRAGLENRAERLTGYLLQAMVSTGTLSVECPYFKLMVQDNPGKVVIDDAKVIPAEYMRQPEPAPAIPDKRKMLDDLKQGVVIDGARLERGKRLVIR